jgi:hypothetical protein
MLFSSRDRDLSKTNLSYPLGLAWNHLEGKPRRRAGDGTEDRLQLGQFLDLTLATPGLLAK